MKYILITLLAFTMMFFTACEVTDCIADGDALLEMDFATKSVAIVEYSEYVMDLADDTADSTAPEEVAEPAAITATDCNDYADAYQDLVDAGCSGYTQAAVDSLGCANFE